MDKRKYVILREATAGLLQDTINHYFEKGYRLKEFAIDSKPLHLYLAVMEHPKINPKVLAPAGDIAD